MTKDQVKAVLARVPTWPDDRQLELAEVALEIEAALAGTEYGATPEELAAIDEGLAGEVASEEEVKAAFASSWQAWGSSIRSVPSMISGKLPPLTTAPAIRPLASLSWPVFKR